MLTAKMMDAVATNLPTRSQLTSCKFSIHVSFTQLFISCVYRKGKERERKSTYRYLEDTHVIIVILSAQWPWNMF